MKMQKGIISPSEASATVQTQKKEKTQEKKKDTLWKGPRVCSPA